MPIVKTSAKGQVVIPAEIRGKNRPQAGWPSLDNVS